MLSRTPWRAQLGGPWPPQPRAPPWGGVMLVLFDGSCRLCQASVRFIVDRDPRATFAFAPLQSAIARRLVPDDPVGPGSSVLLIEDGVLYDGSTAALRIARRLRFPWSLLYALIVVPTAVRDPVYRWVARRRYRWFGRSDLCARLPPHVLARMPTDALDEIDRR